MATTATLLLDSNHLVHFAILHDADDTPEFRQAVVIIRTARLTEPRPRRWATAKSWLSRRRSR